MVGSGGAGLGEAGQARFDKFGYGWVRQVGHGGATLGVFRRG